MNDITPFIGPLQIFIILLILGVCLIPYIFYFITLQNTLKAVSPENRKMPPGQVWLCIIPLFGMIWNFIVVNHISMSLRSEFDQRNIIVTEEKPGNGIGVAYCILSCCGIIPYIGGLASFACIVCWIVYWVKINDYKNRLLYIPRQQITTN